MPKSRDAFIRTEYLDDGKGPPARMLIVSISRFEDLLDGWAAKNGALAAGCTTPASVALSIAEHVLEVCEDLDNPEDDDG